MKYKLIFYIGLLLLIMEVNPLHAQNKTTERELLEKYWYYRYRLKQQFIVVSPDNELGTNIPSNIRHKGGGNIIEWGDTEVHLGFYIAVLATEYRLLKDYGQDYSETLNELKWAMLAVDRIDYYAETHWGGSANLNGFFTRNDGKGCDTSYNCSDCILNIRTNASNYRNTLLQEDGTGLNLIKFASTDWAFNGCATVGAPSEESQDQCWHLLYGLAFVKKMMEGETQTFQNIVGETLTMEQWAKKVAYRIVNYMHDCEVYLNHKHKICLIHGWMIRNPVTKEKVQRGSFPGTLSYGFAEAANWITEQDYGNLHYRYSSQMKLILATDLFDGVAFRYDNIRSRLLATIMGDELLLTQQGIPSTFQFLKFATNSPMWRYEHLPISWYILHGANSPLVVFNNGDIEYYKNFLMAAPNCGPFNLKDPNLPGYSEQWSSVSALIFPERLGSGISDIDKGCYSGLDYMLLHNLYWLAFIEKYPLHNYVERPFYPFSNGIGSHQNPLAMFSRNAIFSFAQILETGNVTYYANSLIQLSPGFSVMNGAYFHAFITGLPQNQNVYEKLNITSCNILKDNSEYKDSSNKYNISCQIEDIIMQSFHDYQNTHPLMDTIPKNLDNFVSSVYPNPTTGKIQILINNTDNAILTLDIYNSIGKLVYKLENIEDDYLEIDITSQLSGLYILKLFDNKSVKMIKKIIKQ